MKNIIKVLWYKKCHQGVQIEYIQIKKIDFYTRNITKIISYKNYNLDKNNINMS